MGNITIKEDELKEVVGCIIEAFEDFLEEKGVYVDNPEKAEAISSGEDPDSISEIYGSDYGDLESAIEHILIGDVKEGDV